MIFGRNPRRGVSLRMFDRFLKSPLLGIDEVGTGAVAGPIYAAGVVLPRDSHPEVLDALEKLGLRDSKQLGCRTREKLFEILTSEPSIKYWVTSKSPLDIEQLGHHEVIGSGFNDIINKFKVEFEDGDILIDGDPNKHVAYNVQWRRAADDTSLTVAAASVIAKVLRDNFMVELQEAHPEFSFGNHKGYLTRTHRQELEKSGACAAHRKNTQPVREFMGPRTELHEASRTSEQEAS